MTRAVWLLPLAALCCHAHVAIAQEVQPYTAAVAVDDAPVHSGPGRNYYVTGRLRRGAEVEVYRQDAGGWLAIRPPEGSFSLVGSRYLRPASGGLATVLDDQVGARVGSLETPDRDVVQVRLTQGEEVELLEPAPVTSPNSRQAWYMISPPAGEFRWIHESRIAGGAQEDVEPRPRRLPPVEEERAMPVAAERARSRSANDRPDGAWHGTELATYQIDRGGDAPRHSAEAADDEEGWTAPERGPIAERSSVPIERATPRRYEDARAPSDEPATRAGGLRAELDAIELALSQMVAQDAGRWDFTEINRRAERLLNQSATAVERGRGRLLLRKIARFEDIAEGYAGVRKSGMQSSRPIAPLDPPAEAPPVASSPRTRSVLNDLRGPGGIGGAGRPTQVMSRRAGAPQFALVDENRQVRYFVTPSSGINLRSYVGKQVEITGLASDARGYSKQVLTAERVDVLSDSVLRR